MCSYAETAMLVAVLDEQTDTARDLASEMTDTELLTFYRQITELGSYVEAEYNTRIQAPLTSARHRKSGRIE